jgi:polyisoprenoid-binding protein YceI
METAEVITKTKWGIDPSHSEIAFKIKHLAITNIKGTFKDFGATIYITEKKHMTSNIDVWINSASINTSDEKRDEHLKAADFFDVKNHKQITFVGTTYEKVDSDGNYTLYGNLTIKGITKQIKLDVEFTGVMKDPWGNEKMGFIINGKINRKYFGLNWNTALEAGGFLVSDQVSINCEIQLIKQA